MLKPPPRASLLISALIGTAALGATRHTVPPGTPGVSPDGDHESWTTAATNIQHAVDRAVSGADEVVVSNGTYTSTGPFGNDAMINITKAITVRSLGGKWDLRTVRNSSLLRRRDDRIVRYQLQPHQQRPRQQRHDPT